MNKIDIVLKEMADYVISERIGSTIVERWLEAFNNNLRRLYIVVVTSKDSKRLVHCAAYAKDAEEAKACVLTRFMHWKVNHVIEINETKKFSVQYEYKV